MATFFSSLFRKIKGRIDHLVFYEAKGQQRLRSLPDISLPVSTSAQHFQRCRLRAVVAFYRANPNFMLRRIWNLAAKDKIMSGYNLFISMNIQAFNESHQAEDYSKLQISAGNLELPLCLQVEEYSQGRVNLQWHNIFDADSPHNEDQLYATWLFDGGSFTLKSLPFPVFRRKDKKALLEIPEIGLKNIHLYIYFADSHHNHFSTSKYFYLASINKC